MVINISDKMYALYREIEEQLPNPYYPNCLYPVYSDNFPSSFSFFAAKNNRGQMRIFKIEQKQNKIGIQRFRFDKKKQLHNDGDFILSTKDDDYNYFKKLLDNRKNI